MTLRQFLRLVTSLLVVSAASVVHAAPRDAATLKKIDEALNVHYLAADYDKAELTLKYAIKSCGTKFCSPEILGKAQVALGAIRGNARQDLAGARAAFEAARSVDPNATLDTALVTPAVLKEFYAVMGREMPPDAKQAIAAADAEAAQAAEAKAKQAKVSPAGNLRCTPISGYEIQTAQPIAVVCEPLEGVVRAELYYRVRSESKYTSVLMTVQDGTLRATIPCDKLAKPTKLEIYVLAQDFNKETIDTFGIESKPAHYEIVKKTSQATPSYPDQPAPARCAELLVERATAGQACSPEHGCGRGLYCAQSVCAEAPSCETPEDCGGKSCIEGICQMGDTYLETKPNSWMLGLHAAADLWLAPAVSQVCGYANITAGNFYCYDAGEDRVYLKRRNRTEPAMVDPNGGGNIAAGIRMATVRMLLSADRVFTPNLSAGVRIGWAFGGGPRTIEFDTQQNDYRPTQHRPFFPVHLEARGTLWLRSLGKLGLHPYVHLGGGVAEVDAKVPINGKKTYEGDTFVSVRKLDAWRKLGILFVTGGFGGLYSLTQRHGIQLNVNAMYLFTAKGTVIEPSLGYVYGF